MTEKKRIGIIFGGQSGEYEVSLLSAASVIRAMNRKKFELVLLGITKEGQWKSFCGSAEAIEDGSWIDSAEDFSLGKLKETIDFALPVVHGPYCEDGKLQGFLETVGIPYGGCGVLASAVAMDKGLAKEIFLQHGLPICKYLLLRKESLEKEMEQTIEQIEEVVGLPCFVKPANMGSSVGISKAENAQELESALKLAARYDRRIVVEEAINCRELETGILGNEAPAAAAVGEILPTCKFYDYSSKYADGGAQLCIPASVDTATYEKIRSLAVEAYKAIDGEGYARVDFFIDKESGQVYLNEINTIPGFTKYSMFPLLWKEAGLEYADLLERIIELGYERYYNKNNGKTSI